MASHPRISRTLWPLPGGTGSYLTSLSLILQLVAESTDADAAVAALVERFDQVSSPKASRTYLHVVADLGLIELDGYHVDVTETGIEYLKTRDPQLVERSLLDRIEGVTDIIDMLRARPRRIGLLHSELKQRGFASWTTDKQIRYRLRWLEEVGLVGKRGKARPEYFVIES